MVSAGESANLPTRHISVSLSASPWLCWLLVAAVSTEVSVLLQTDIQDTAVCHSIMHACYCDACTFICHIVDKAHALALSTGTICHHLHQPMPAMCTHQNVTHHIAVPDVYGTLTKTAFESFPTPFKMKTLAAFTTQSLRSYGLHT